MPRAARGRGAGHPLLHAEPVACDAGHLREAPALTPRRAVHDLLFVEHGDGFGGSTVALGSLLSGLDRARFRPHVVVAYPAQRDHLLRHGPEGLGIDVVQMDRGGRRPRTGGGGRLRRGLRSAVMFADTLRRATPYALAIRRIARAHRVDLIHLNNNVSGNLGGVLGAIWAGIPCVIKQRGFDWSSPETRWLARRVRRFMADTQAIANDVARLGVPAERITVTYCPIDVASYGSSSERLAVRAELGLASGATVFGILGRLTRWKGQHVFVEAAAAVLARLPGARALVVGSAMEGADREYEGGLRRRVAELGIGDRVVFTGHRPDVPRVLQALDVVVHASIEPEPFGLVIAEAMAARRPVVASREAGPMEIVGDGVSGILVPPGDAAEMAEAIVKLLADPELARRMGEAGRAIVAEKFTVERHVARTERVYLDVLEPE